MTIPNNPNGPLAYRLAIDPVFAEKVRKEVEKIDCLEHRIDKITRLCFPPIHNDSSLMLAAAKAVLDEEKEKIPYCVEKIHITGSITTYLKIQPLQISEDDSLKLLQSLAKTRNMCFRDVPSSATKDWFLEYDKLIEGLVQSTNTGLPVTIRLGTELYDCG